MLNIGILTVISSGIEIKMLQMQDIGILSITSVRNKNFKFNQPWNVKNLCVGNRNIKYY